MNDNFTDIDDLPPSLLIEDDIAESLKNFATTGTPLHRRMYARVLELMLQKPLEEILEHINTILTTMLLIAEDDDPTIRISLVDKIPHIFKRCHELNNSDIEYYFYNILIQIVIKYLKDDDNASVVAYSSLSCLLNRKYIDVKRIEEMLCPAIIEMTKKIDVQEIDNQLNAIGLIARVAPLIGRDKTEKLLLNRFIEMCSDDAYYIRRGCAVNYAIICQVMGEEVTENQLINSFIKLCQDDVWGIRKACAECLPMIALLCSRECRKNVLAPTVFELLNDSSLWVSNTAYMKLGNFLSSFAIPCITGLAFSENGELYITNAIDDEEFRNSCNKEMLKNLEYYDQLFAESTLPLDSDFIKTENASNTVFSVAGTSSTTNLSTTEATVTSSSPTVLNLLKNENFHDIKVEGITMNNYLNMYSNEYSTRKYDSYEIAASPPQHSVIPQVASDTTAKPIVALSLDLSNNNNNEKTADISKGTIIAPLAMTAAVEEDISSTKPKIKITPIYDLAPLTVEKKHMIGNRRFSERHGKNFYNNQKRQQSIDGHFMHLKNAPEDLPSIVKLAIENQKMEQQKHIKLFKQPHLLGTSVVTSSSSAEITSTTSEGTKINWNHNDNLTELETPDIDSAPTSALAFPIVTTECNIYNDNNLVNKVAATKNMDSDNKRDDEKNVCNLDNVFYDDDSNMGIVSGKINLSLVNSDTVGVGDTANTYINKIKNITDFGDNKHNQQKQDDDEEEEDSNFNSHQFWYLSPAPLELEDINLILEKQKTPATNIKTTKLTTTVLPSLTLNENKENLHFHMNNNNNHNVKRRTILSKFDNRVYEYEKNSSRNNDIAKATDDDDDKLENNSIINNYNKSIATIASLTTARKISEICKNSKYKQDIIPIDLLDYYVKMSTMAEKDINIYCATNFPAIVLTLGRSNWHLLYNLLHSLANDIHSTIRKILASSIYLIALIIGREYATKDLVPIYINFFSDFDEVKIVAIRNLSNFLKVIRPSRHFEIIDTLPECFDPDNKGYSNSWRFREEYALQILKLIEIHDVYIRNDESLTFLEVAVITLLSDKISCIRQIGLDAMIARIKCCKSDYCSVYKLLIENFRYSNDWRKRQTFILFCCKLIEENINDDKLINQELIKHINGMVFDSIANIRMFVAKFLAKEIIRKGYFKNDLPLRTIIIDWIYILQIDKDRDVREMAACDEIPSIYENTESYQKILNDFSNYHNIIVLEKVFQDNHVTTGCNDDSNLNNNNSTLPSREKFVNTNNDEKNTQDKISISFNSTNNVASSETAAEARESDITRKNEDFGSAKHNDNDATFDSYFEQLISNIRLEEPTDDDANDIQMLITKDDNSMYSVISSSSSSNSCSSSSSENSNNSYSGGDQQQLSKNNMEMSNNNESPQAMKTEIVMQPIVEECDVVSRNPKVENVAVVGSIPEGITSIRKDRDSQQNTTIVEEVTAVCLENNNFKSIIIETDNFAEK